MFALAALTIAASFSSYGLCTPIAHTQALWNNHHLRWLVVGEQHGTNETPAAFADLVCLASRHRAIVVAVEQPVSEQKAIDAFTMSDGGLNARTAFLKSLIWSCQFSDGRSSKAYFHLFDDLRKLRLHGRIRAVVAIQPTTFPSSAGYEKLMARWIVRKSQPGALTIVLVGNVHAMRTPVSFSGHVYLPMAAMLPESQTITLDVRSNGGVQWSCASPSHCGPQEIPAMTQPHHRELILSAEGEPSFSGVLYLGGYATASYPQSRQSSETACEHADP